MAQKIKSVVGPEPMREGGYPESMVVGLRPWQQGDMEIAYILRSNNLGTSQPAWYVGYHKDGHILKQMNETYVASVEFFKEQE